LAEGSFDRSILRDPSLYIGAIVSSFVFAFIEAYVGLFNLAFTGVEVTEIIVLSVIGIFVSLLITSFFANLDHKMGEEIVGISKRHRRRKRHKKSTKPNTSSRKTGKKRR